jgi:enolase
MKNTTERTLFHRLLFSCIPVLFLFLGSACQKDSEVDDTTTKIIGTWQQTSQSKDDILTAKDSTRLLMQINADQICILCDSTAVAVKAKTIIKRSGWSYTGGLFNLAIDLPASYKPVTDANTLTLERVDFNQSGVLVKTTLKFNRVANLEIK